VVKIKYDIDIMKYMSLFESLSGAKVKDCIVNDVIFFIVHENEMGKAIGKQGSNIKRVENTLKKKIKLAEFNNDISQFIQNLIYPLKAKEIKEEEGAVTIYVDDRKTKGMLIGRDRHNINSIKDIVKRHFKVEEIKVA
jgi:N utilization substance protein A